MKRVDVVVLGAGIIGICTALQLQRAGMEVALVDHGAPGEGTSFGNAGLIERASLYPYAFPRQLSTLLRYAGNRSVEAHYHWGALLRIAPQLARYWWNSAPQRHERIMQAARPLIEHSVHAHNELAALAQTQQVLHTDGWIKVARHQATLDRLLTDVTHLQGFGLQIDVLDRAALRLLEPSLSDAVQGGVHFRDPLSVRDPIDLSRAYVAYFEKIGGLCWHGDAQSLTQIAGGQWQVDTEEGAVQTERAVLCLGAWTGSITRRLGYRFPLFVKRGYHKHYALAHEAQLNHTVLDADGGFVLARMQRGVRLTTGVEFADLQAPPTPVQLARAEPLARELLPLGEAMDAEAWMGHRPCFPDILPIIGQAPRHRGLWLHFGHHHHGLTQAASAGLLLAQMMSGQTPFTDPAPYRAERFRA